MAITYVDTEYTKAYLRHLFAANEYLGKIATSIILGLYVVGS
jgi:queuine tRNA-ribosyltransferase